MASLTPCPPLEESVDRPLQALAGRVRSELAEASEERRLVRVCVPLSDPVDPIQWLRAQTTADTVYWSPRTSTASQESLKPEADQSEAAEGPAVAGIGQADLLVSRRQPIDYQRLGRRLSTRLDGAAPGVRYFGGLRFDAPQSHSADVATGPWQAFGTYRFVLPRVELIDWPDRQVLACNLVLPRDADRRDDLPAAIASLPAARPDEEGALPAPSRRTDRPDRVGWTRMVRWALDAIEKGRLDKVVFARQVALGLDRCVDPLRVLQHLKAATPGCFHFALGPPDGPTFVGASPERLFRREGGDVVSEAVAGTRARGDTPETDAALREELLTSEKERREHAFVQRALEDALRSLCISVDGADRPSDLALARGRHLHAAIRGTLRPETSTVDLLEALHPTPAVGGVPTDGALSAIREQEPFDRGWYAGPVGWVGPDAADFAVGIRSGLLRPDRLALFSGAGIVDGSQPDREWAEIEQKIADFAAVLGLLRPQDEARP